MLFIDLFKKKPEVSPLFSKELPFNCFKFKPDYPLRN